MNKLYAKLKNRDIVDITGYEQYDTYSDENPDEDIFDGYGNGDKYYPSEDILFVSSNLTDMFDDIVVSRKESFCNDKTNTLCGELRSIFKNVDVNVDYIELYGMVWKVTKEGYPKLEPVAKKTKEGWELLWGMKE